MSKNKPQSALPIRAHLAGIEIVGDLKGNSSTTRPDHYVVVHLDDKEVVESEKKPRVPTPQWKWQEDQRFWFHPSSTIKVAIYRKSRARISKHLVGQYTGQIIELLENKETIDLKDKNGTAIASKIKVDLSLVSEPEERFMDAVIADAARLDSTIRVPSGMPVLWETLQLTKNIMDVVAQTHPILNASWTVLSAVYKVVQQAELLDDNIRDLTENLRETLGVAKEYPDLLVIAGTTNVIEEIGRTSLKVASLIHEYTKPSFAGRVLKSQISNDMQSRVAECLKSCTDLKQKFDRRMGMDTNRAVKEAKGDMDKNHANIQNTLKTIKDDQLVREIQQWLCAPDSSRNYNDAHDKRQKNTCSWFLEGSRFRELQERADFLWIKGTTGCGKTILCSSIIDKIIQLQKENASVHYAYFFFDGRDSQTELQLHDKLIRSLIWQLSLQCDGIPAALVELYGRGHQQPSTSSLEDTLRRIIDGLPSTYVIIDSLDECTEREKTLQWIEQTISLDMGDLHMVVTSRPERDISDALQLLDPRCIDLVNESANHDITTYLEQQLSLMKKWDEETRKIVQSTLTERAQGMFRWVALQLMELKKCSTRRSVMSQLDDLPKGLYDTYDRILSKIDNQANRTDAKTLLRWLCFSVRPMKLVEIAETVAVDFDMENGPQYSPAHRYWDEQDVMEKCAGLITESSEGNVKLAHFSIKEYLLSEHLRIGAISWIHLTSNKHSHSLIAQTCLAYLMHFDKPDLVNENMAIVFPLAPYAAQYWIFHAKSGDINEPEHSLSFALAKQLFTSENPRYNWLRIWDLDNPVTSSTEYRKQSEFGPPLYYAALAGLEQLSLQLMEHGNVNEQGGNHGDALQAASARGHEGIVKALLAKGADVHLQGGYFGNALEAASTLGRERIVKLLLENGADVNGQGDRYGNALQMASSGKHEGVVELLLENGADANAQRGYFGNALQAASYAGNERIVKLLVEKGADVNAQGGFYGNALQAAAHRGHEEIMKLLLEKGANVNMQGGQNGNALQAASASGYEGMVKLLLAKGADVNAEGGFYGNALQASSVAGHEGIVKLLLEKGMDASVQGGFYGNALQAASAGGNVEIVKLLLQKGADVNVQGGFNGNALQVASHRGHEGIVKLLLEKGATVNMQGGKYDSAVQAASFGGHEGIVKVLLEKGADVNTRGGFYGNALQVASNRGHEGVVTLLVERGADVNAQGGYFGNALQAASDTGNEGIVKLLVKKGSGVNAQGGEYGNALQAASADGHAVIVKLLLDQGADVSAQGGFYGNALQAASHRGHEEIVKLLLEKGANVNAQGGYFNNAFQAASDARHKEIMKLLVEKGADVNAEGGFNGSVLPAMSHEGQWMPVRKA